MKKIIKSKRVLYIVLPILALGFIAGVPINDDKTILEELIGAFPSMKVTEAEQEKSRQSMDEVWAEMQKIAAHNNNDSVSISGKVRLFDNLFEEGIREEQSFQLMQTGENQWFHLDSLDRVQYNKALIMIDHAAQEISIHPPGVEDSLTQALKMMDPEKFKDLLIKDGTTAEVTKSGEDKILSIYPGSMDGANRYDFYYDASTYKIKKVRVYYTSTPYQDYVEVKNSQPSENTDLNTSTDQTSADDIDTEEEMDIPMNITEYVLEFEITTSAAKCDMDFDDNKFYKINHNGEVNFTGKLLKYKKVMYQ